MCEEPKEFYFFSFSSFFFFSLSPQREKMESSPKKRNEPIREEMTVGRGTEVIRGEGWAEGLR